MTDKITLPNFEVTLIQKDNDSFNHTVTTLPKFIKEQDKGLILYFYPKDNTAGCTVQATEFTAFSDEFAKKGYMVIGVSRDSQKSHENFITKQNLNIALISDTDETLCQHFDVIKEKTMYGKKVMGVVRSTFVFDKDGTLIHEYRNVKSKTHQTELLSAL